MLLPLALRGNFHQSAELSPAVIMTTFWLVNRVHVNIQGLIKGYHQTDIKELLAMTVISSHVACIWTEKFHLNQGCPSQKSSIGDDLSI